MPSKPANLCGAAVGMATAAVQRLGIAPLAEPEVRTATASAAVALAARIDALKPRGRVQRAVQLTKAERRELKTEQQRKSRAQEKQLEEQAQHFMA